MIKRRLERPHIMWTNPLRQLHELGQKPLNPAADLGIDRRGRIQISIEADGVHLLGDGVPLGLELIGHHFLQAGLLLQAYKES